MAPLGITKFSTKLGAVPVIVADAGTSGSAVSTVPILNVGVNPSAPVAPVAPVGPAIP